MKGFLKFGVLALVIVLVSGCGSKEEGKVLTCTKSSNEDGMTTEVKVKVNFKEDKATKLSMDTKMTLSDDVAKLLDVSGLKEMLDQEFEEATKKNGISYSSSAKGKSINFTIEIDRTKISSEDLDGMDLDNMGADTYDAAKTSFEKDGYTCK